MPVDPELILSEEEFEALTPKEQEAYLKLLNEDGAAWRLHGKQLVADALADQANELLYGGAAGGGKSEWILNRAWRLSREIPGHRSLILRTSFPELRRSIISRSVVLYAQHTPPDEMPNYRVSDKEWRFPNGSVIEFGYCASDEDVAQFLSAEYQMIAFDEATQFTEEQYELIRSRARATRSLISRGARPHIIAATNPGQRGHGYFKSIFVDTTEYGERPLTWLVRDGERWRAVVEGEDFDKSQSRLVAFVPSTVLDNPHIDPAYVNHLRTLPDKLMRQYLYGDWDLMEGMFFDEFRRNITDDAGLEIQWHVIDPFPIPDGWRKIRAIDFGFSAPFCCLWITWDEDGNAYVYREVYRTRMTPTEQAAVVLKSTPTTEKVDVTFADPSVWQKRDALTVAQQWANAGLKTVKASNDRVAGWQRVRDYLKPNTTSDAPGLRIFNTCPDLIRTLPLQIHDKHNPEDLNTTLEDHAVDALRYGLMTRPRKNGVPRQVLTGIAAHVAKTFKTNKNYHPILGKQV